MASVRSWNGEGRYEPLAPPPAADAGRTTNSTVQSTASFPEKHFANIFFFVEFDDEEDSSSPTDEAEEEEAVDGIPGPVFGIDTHAPLSNLLSEIGKFQLFVKVLEGVEGSAVTPRIFTTSASTFMNVATLLFEEDEGPALLEVEEAPEPAAALPEPPEAAEEEFVFACPGVATRFAIVAALGTPDLLPPCAPILLDPGGPAEPAT